jgi:ABC-2 type transport system ATP-binding protein
MLLAEGLYKQYADVVALAGFDLVVMPGEIAGLIGHNGAGKTTFVEIVAGLVRTDAGRVEVAGVDVARRPRAARALLGIAPQEMGLYPAATLRENLLLFGGLAGVRRRALRRELDDLAFALELGEVLDRRVALLSGGQRRRAQTATALISRADVLLLDEPTVGADPATREAVLAAVRRRADDGAAVCYTTHYLPELGALQATIALARAGRVIARGSQAALLSQLPGQVRVRFAGPVPRGLLLGHGSRAIVDDELVIHTDDPGRAVGELVADPESSAQLASVQVLNPTLDDLYRRLAKEDDRAA